jgi:hypothetical protein
MLVLQIISPEPNESEMSFGETLIIRNRERIMKLKYLAASILATTFASSAAFAATPSAKFAATYTDTPALASVAVITDATADQVVTDSKTGYTLATIKVPEQKELLVGVSAEIGLVTETSVKGKNGGTATATAGAEAYVTVFAVPKSGGPSAEAAPGKIVLSKRIQALTATLGGVIQSCTDSLTVDTDGDGEPDATDGTIDVATECVVTDEQIGLLQDTTAAHHFNFVLPDLPQGVYDIKAVFTTGGHAEVDICDSAADCALYDPDGTVSASSTAKAIINKTMVTVQQVRAAKGGVIDAEIIEQ